MRKRARLIYNPTSGKEQVTKQLADILNVYELAGYDTSCFQTTPEPLSAMYEAKRCALDQFDLIIAAGGDGTINEVVNGIASVDNRPTLAVIPAGTTNDFARSLSIPLHNLVEAAELIYIQQCVQMDIGRIGLCDHQSGEPIQQYFVNIGAAGSLTELTYEVPSQWKSILGTAAYFAKGAELLPRLGDVPLHIQYDDGEYSGNASLVFVSLTNSVGGFEKLAPDTVMGDGKFTLIIVKTAHMADLMRLLSLVIRSGQHVDSDQLIYTKTSRVTLRSLSDEEVLINLDGELGGKAPAMFQTLKQHITVVANPSDMMSDIYSTKTL